MLKSIKPVFSVNLIFIFFIIFLFSSSVIFSYASAQEERSTILTAIKTDEKITIDGIANESSWEKAPKLIVPVYDGKIGNVDVEMKALYDSEYIYLYVYYPDKTKSDKLLWIYNGSAWLPPNTTEQDMFTIYWNIDDSVKGFDIAGCAITCHADRMHTNSPEEKVDMWKWMSAYHNPANYAMDRYLDNEVVIGDKVRTGYSKKFITKTWHAHKDDEIIGDYIVERKNAIVGENGNYLGPRYYKPDATGEDAYYLTMEDIKSGRAVEFRNLSYFNDGKAVPKGFKVPAYIAEKPKGSAGDIEAKGYFDSSGWHIEFKRKLKTGHKDDVQFDITRIYRFSIAVHDDSRGSANTGIGHGHSISLVAKTLEFGGLGSKEIADLALIRDYLTTAKAHIARNERGLALSTVADSLSVFNKIRDSLAEKDPELYLATKNQFFEVRKNPTAENIEELIKKIDDAILTFQGKRKPIKPSLSTKILVLWGKLQFYAFVILAIIVLPVFYRMIRTSKKKEFRYISIFVAMIVFPIFIEGVGRIGVAFKVPVLQMFSFTSSEFMTLLWAIGMFIALYIGRLGFNELDNAMKNLEYYSKELEKRMEELKKSQEELLRAERLASIGQLAASMAHELRNPLGVMKNASYYLKMAKLKDEAKIKKHIGIIDRELERANKIIGDLLEFSVGRKPVMRSINISNLISDALSRVDIPGNIKLKLNIPENFKIYCDAEQIQRVFINLILNAIQAMEEGGELEITARREGGRALISFKDTGRGIEKENLEKIFEPLFTTKAKGIGLGLALSKQVIEAHGGEIKVKSEVNRGSEFTVILPLKKQKEKKLRENEK